MMVRISFFFCDDMDMQGEEFPLKVKRSEDGRDAEMSFEGAVVVDRERRKTMLILQQRLGRRDEMVR